MKYKVLPSCDLYTALTAIQLKMVECNNAANTFVKGLGYERFRLSSYRNGHQVIAGGVSSIEILTGKPEGWRKAVGHKEYMPSKLKKNKDLLDKIAALPFVTNSEITDLLKYDWRNTTKSAGNRISFCPGVIWKKKLILIDVADYVKYKPVAGMVEILESEYQKLSQRK